MVSVISDSILIENVLFWDLDSFVVKVVDH